MEEKKDYWHEIDIMWKIVNHTWEEFKEHLNNKLLRPNEEWEIKYKGYLRNMRMVDEQLENVWAKQDVISKEIREEAEKRWRSSSIRSSSTLQTNKTHTT
jgi:hypothetical protein